MTGHPHRTAVRKRCFSGKGILDGLHAGVSDRGSSRDSHRRLEYQDDPESLAPEIAFYRRRTEAMLRRYLRMSLDVGRVPSCLPREFARARRSSLRGPSFEDRIIFVHDIERCMRLLDSLANQILVRVALQEYSRREAAEMLGMTPSKLSRSYDDALDRMSTILLGHQLMRSL